jgi:hypothetical protein
MVKNSVSIFILSILLSISTSAQKETRIETKIKTIRDLYTETNLTIKEIESDTEKAKGSRFAVNELVVNKLDKSWAAVGNYKVVYRFYYQNTGEEPYPTQLVKVTIATESAARRYFEEFLYDRASSLVFYFEKSEEDEAPAERRIYFDKWKAIRFIENKNQSVKLSAIESEIVEKILRKSHLVADIFNKSIQ